MDDVFHHIDIRFGREALEKIARNHLYTIRNARFFKMLTLQGPLYWHIDRFESLEKARAAVGPTSIAFEADRSWLMTIEPQTSDHHGGRHVTQLEPLPMPQAPKYAMQVQSAVFKREMYSLVHHHSGVDAVYVIKGEACFETPTRAHKLRKGETLAIPAETPMLTVRSFISGT